MWRKPTPSLYKYNQNFKLNNCAISKNPETSHIFKPLLNAVLYFRNLKDNATFYRKVWFSAFHCHANLICRAKFGFPQRIFNTKLFGKVRFRFHLSRKSFRQVFLKIIKRKNRSEAFCVSSENILHLTLSGLRKWQKSKP